MTIGEWQDTTQDYIVEDAYNFTKPVILAEDRKNNIKDTGIKHVNVSLGSLPTNNPTAPPPLSSTDPIISPPKPPNDPNNATIELSVSGTGVNTKGNGSIIDISDPYNPVTICQGSNIVCYRQYPKGKTLHLTSKPGDGSTFAKWSVPYTDNYGPITYSACSSPPYSSDCIFTIPNDSNYSRIRTGALFVGIPGKTNIIINTSGSGSGTVFDDCCGPNTPLCSGPGKSCSIAYSNGLTLGLSAAPDSGSVFTGWDCRISKVDGYSAGVYGDRCDIPLNGGSYQVTANFSKPNNTVPTNPNPQAPENGGNNQYSCPKGRVCDSKTYSSCISTTINTAVYGWLKVINTCPMKLNVCWQEADGSGTTGCWDMESGNGYTTPNTPNYYSQHGGIVAVACLPGYNPIDPTTGNFWKYPYSKYFCMKIY